MLLETFAGDRDVSKSQRADRPLQEPCLPLARFEQYDLCPRPYNSQRNSREAAAASDVQNTSRRLLEEREGVERIEDVSRVERGTIPLRHQCERGDLLVEEAGVSVQKPDGPFWKRSERERVRGRRDAVARRALLSR